MANYTKPTCNGNSVAYEASGDLLFQAGEKEGVYLVAFDLEKLRKYFELEKEFKEEIEGIVKILKKNYLRIQIKRIRSKIEQAEMDEDKNEVKKLIKSLMEFTDKLGEI